MKRLSVFALIAVTLSTLLIAVPVLGNEGDMDRSVGISVVNAVESSPYVKPKTYRMIYNLTFLNIDATVDSVELWMPLPVVWDSQKDVTLERTDPEVTEQSKDSQYGNGILYWKLGAVSRGSSKTVTMQVVFTAYEILYEIDPTEVGVYDKASSEYKQYTKSEDYVEADYGPIKEEAKRIVGEETNPYRQARLIYNWVLQHMTYRVLPQSFLEGGAKFAYDNGYGECYEYAALFAALSRAVGTPARLVVGLSWDGVGVYPRGEDRGLHVWAEFLLPGYGWVPADGSIGDGSGRPNDYFASNPDSDDFLIMSKGTNILLKPEFTTPELQTGVYSYHGRTGSVDISYKYLVAEIRPATTETRPSQQPVELVYDDGTSEWSWWKTSAGVGGYDAVRFSPPFESCQVVTVKYYIRSSPASFNVLILDANRRSIFDKSATPTAEGWFEIDLSKENIILDGDFYAAMKWIVPEKPALGADETKPDGRSFFVAADGTWQTYADVRKIKDGDFMIRATVDRPKVKVALQVEPNIGGVTVDGVSYSADRLPATFMWETGSSHTLLVDPTISGAAGVPYAFIEWSDGSKDISRTISAIESADLTARFKTQYELKVTSDLGDPQGSGWYDAGSTAMFSVTSPQPETGLFGSLGGKMVFEARTGDSAANTATASITMDGPKTVQAEWTTDDSEPYMILGGIGIAIMVAIIVAFVLIRRRGAAPPPPPIIPTRSAPLPPQPAATQPPSCVNCGSPMIYIQEHQRYYCYNCQQYA
jgi:transglutaminase-like putative cysteine protease